MSIKMELVTVTPEMAREFLTHNTNNRSINRKHVEGIKRTIANGTFQVNGDTICFDTNGVMTDGQHRAKAIEESGIAVQCIVVTGLKPETFRTKNTGCKTRSAQDVLGIAGYKNGNLLHAAISVAQEIRRLTTHAPAFGRVIPEDSLQFLMQFEWAYPVFTEAAHKCQRVKPFRNGKVLGALLYCAGKTNPLVALEFFNPIFSCEGLNKDTPQYAVNRYFLTKRTSAHTMQDANGLVIAFGKWLVGSSQKAFCPREELPEINWDKALAKYRANNESPSIIKQLFGSRNLAAAQ